MIDGVLLMWCGCLVRFAKLPMALWLRMPASSESNELMNSATSGGLRHPVGCRATPPRNETCANPSGL